MDTPTTMAAIIVRIERAMHRVAEAIRPLSPAQMLEPRLSDGRSVKDVLGHMTWWDQWLLVTLPPEQNAPTDQIILPLADQIPPTGEWADEMNARVHRYNQGRDLSHILADFTATRNHLLRRVSQFSLEDLSDDGPISAAIGQPVAPLVLGIYEHYEEHAHELEQLRW